MLNRLWSWLQNFETNDNPLLTGKIPAGNEAAFERVRRFGITNTSLSGTIPPSLCRLDEYNASVAVFECSNHLCGCACQCA